MTRTERTLFEPTPAERLQERFEELLRDRPDVYREFVQLALAARRRGRERWSADAIGHVLRWQRMMSDPGDELFKISDHFICLLARKAMREHAELAGFFEIRRSKIDSPNEMSDNGQ